MLESPHREAAIIINVFVSSITNHVIISPSSCAAELEVGAKGKKSFVQKSIFYGEFVKKNTTNY